MAGSSLAVALGCVFLGCGDTQRDERIDAEDDVVNTIGERAEEEADDSGIE